MGVGVIGQISAIYKPDGTSFEACRTASRLPFFLVFCEQIITELREVFCRKFPHKIKAMEQFLSTILYQLLVLSPNQLKTRGVDDRPILRGAAKARVAVLVTGDKDFLESTIRKAENRDPISVCRHHEILIAQ